MNIVLHRQVFGYDIMAFSFCGDFNINYRDLFYCDKL